MKNTAFYSFSELLQDVRQDTGLSNLRSSPDDIKQMIARAEFEINPYAGFLRKKRMIYHKGNGNFDGKAINKPSDFVMLDEKGMCKDGLCGNKIHVTISHIVLCDNKERDKVAFNYWAIACDGEGNPIIPMNHKEAVVNFVIYKMFQPKVFNGEAAANTLMMYQRNWEDSCMAARGYDAFPDQYAIERVYELNSMTRQEAQSVFCQDFCTTDDCIETFEDIMITVNLFQLNGVEKDITSPEQVTQEFIDQFSEAYSTEQLLEGVNKSFPYAGRYGFIAPSDLEFRVKDILGSDLSSTFNVIQDEANNRRIYVSKNYISPSTIYLQMF